MRWLQCGLLACAKINTFIRSTDEKVYEVVHRQNAWLNNVMSLSSIHQGAGGTVKDFASWFDSAVIEQNNSIVDIVLMTLIQGCTRIWSLVDD